MSQPSLHRIAVVGGGPAGMVLALLLARAGVRVTVLERNADFSREFRGEVLQPRFMHAAREGGFFDLIQKIPHEKFSDFRFFLSSRSEVRIPLAKIDSDFPFVTWMTQPDLLEGLCKSARKHDNFTIEFNADVQGVVDRGDAGIEVTYRQNDQTVSQLFSLVVGADGRFSRIRKLGGFEIEYAHHGFDVIWFECERPNSYAHGADFFRGGKYPALILPKYPNKIQVGLIVAVGEGRQILRSDRAEIAGLLKQIHPIFLNIAEKLVEAHSFAVLDARVELVKRWSSNRLLLIGDAAHTCSPAGAIGVTIAVETAICAANVIANCARKNDFSAEALAEVQYQRDAAIRRVHRLQMRAVKLLRNAKVPSFLLRFILKTGLAMGILPRLLRSFIGKA
jgi:2-polyprenyl-6-methoxyphenol hydroxylase-like FAD-dependent oxidoreductase